jgi:hypothetical protein
MMLCRLSVVLIVTALSACASMPEHSAKFDESKPLHLPCLAEAEKVHDAWYVHISRNPGRTPDDSERFASGAFVARVSVWVTFAGDGQQLVTVLVGSANDRELVDTGRVSTGHMISGKKIVDVSPNKCEAFPPLG